MVATNLILYFFSFQSGYINFFPKIFHSLLVVHKEFSGVISFTAKTFFFILFWPCSMLMMVIR